MKDHGEAIKRASEFGGRIWRLKRAIDRAMLEAEDAERDGDTARAAHLLEVATRLEQKLPA
jgi:hypothetical protein